MEKVLMNNDFIDKRNKKLREQWQKIVFDNRPIGWKFCWRGSFGRLNPHITYLSLVVGQS